MSGDAATADTEPYNLNDERLRRKPGGRPDGKHPGRVDSAAPPDVEALVANAIETLFSRTFTATPTAQGGSRGSGVMHLVETATDDQSSDAFSADPDRR